MRRNVPAGPSVAKVAAVIGDPARALMLTSMMDGRSYTAGELARIAGIAPQTASTHLGKLADAKLVAIEAHGRHRYHRIASPDIASAIEGLMAIAPSTRPSHGPVDADLRRARSCYDHLAGELAVRIAESFAARGLIMAESPWSLSQSGLQWLVSIGADLPDPTHNRPEVRWCMDWSERRLHIAGQLGAKLLTAFIANDWVRRRTDSRTLSVTPLGESRIGNFLRE